MARIEQQDGRCKHFVVGEPVGAVLRADEIAHQVVAKIGAALGEQRTHIVGELLARPQRRVFGFPADRRLVHPDDRLRPRPKLREVGARRAEQLGDDEHRERLGIVAERVEGRGVDLGEQLRPQR
jgi:hypothetical protein